MMSRVIQEETMIFLLSVAHGAGMTFCYDLIRAVRRVFSHGLIAISIEDFLFWAMAGFLTFCLAFFYTDGIIRGYVAAGMAIGFLLYHFAFSKAVVAGVAWLLGRLKSVICAVLHILFIPVEKTGHLLKKIIEIARKAGYNKIKCRLNSEGSRMKGKYRVNKKEKRGNCYGHSEETGQQK